ncbi:hypothetical protein [Bosea beijingensis]|uniref:hypothetical protein n=1 Tax=Bosea beijingensis TaxID=3068632 RepID=UPI00274233BC|nr:hypothetical protein [Bosea sp. REN20]
MTLRPAYDEIVLEHGNHAVILRPSLRAASTLERRVGFGQLPRRIAEFHTGTVREIILTAATDRKDAAAFLNAMSRLPISRFVEIAQKPVRDLCDLFLPIDEASARPATSAPAITLPRLFQGLFRTATGLLGWTPEQAWNATPTEISEAFIGRAGEPEKQDQTDPEQAARNEAAGLDPEFDRAGLHALKAKYGRKPR